MFIRKKKIGGKVYHYLVKSVRVGDRVQQKVLAYLGEHDNLEAAWEERNRAHSALSWQHSHERKENNELGNDKAGTRGRGRILRPQGQRAPVVRVLSARQGTPAEHGRG